MIVGAVDAILVFVILEGVALVLWRRATGTGPRAAAVPAMLAAGFFLMLALRLALGGAEGTAIAACLLAALVAHGLDLAGRWRP